MSSTLSIIQPLTPHNSTCGYCSPPGQRSVAKSNYHSAELSADRLSCMAYQGMIDRGWRRSGTYCYKPDMKRSCCPQYTIRLDALEFKPSKSQRKLINRFNRFIFHGDEKEPSTGSGNKKQAKKEAPFALTVDLHASESRTIQDGSVKHKFEVTLEHSSFTEEKFDLFEIYQKDIHHEDDKDPDGFNRFLVETPLHYEAIPYPGTKPDHLPSEYGSYHQLYRLDGELIAMGIIDILPHCVSSVYFMYNSTWERFSLGRLSALREISLAREIHDAGVPNMQFLYMGFYIHSCPKMRYKGEYSPSFLADPEDYSWHPLGQCKTLLDNHRFACFTHPEHSLTEVYKGPADGTDIPPEGLDEVQCFDSIHQNKIVTKSITDSYQWRVAHMRKRIITTVNGLGLPLAKEIIFYV
ncbi:hypothetical protein QCA50_000129 [Cerrena zonata]|uniref:arginyltransferase n=1 Tax=Cerrena zonata TaxID=2478898 RepID=A0AAW0GXC3_9APHY